ncbi:DUF1911 domain-containing protein [Colwellia sp. D2M02]|uniref:PoNe immunity protein domain-containing protein n=1 Tax=Colwellia sp. D2M02 TaxID=2841562 RepID=UPI001C0A5C98|nr:PoNe immunity protein domain-containing protein [Colwellia sp. D2M02]MBU2894366.1 DUF1911 domain-containing protein [Colwellia sp. D2M02]
MLRDKLKNKIYFDEYIEYSLETIDEDLHDLESDKSLNIDSKMKFSFGLVNDSVRLMHLRYSRGDNLSEFIPHLDAILKYREKQKYYADLLPENEQKKRIGWEEIREDYLEDWLNWLAFAYCLNVGQSYYQKVLVLLGSQGLDAVFDSIAVKMGDSSREVNNTVLFKKRFNKLHLVIEATPEQQPKMMLAYLNAWYKLYGSPDLHLMDTDTYKGYWCWEAALVVKLYNIDDSSFIDHEYYPKDLVHWQDNNK